jgi:endonuclease VIII
MEGPSLFLAVQQLKPFKKRVVLEATGNTRIDKARFVGREVKDIFAWGKHLVFQFDEFAARFHFLLWGNFEAEVEGKYVTGDYRRARVPRLAFKFDNGKFESFSCSVRFVETRNAKRDYDFTTDIMSPKWDGAAALKKMKARPKEQIGDILLDQHVFTGVGNIIKNEVLSLTRTHPETRIGKLSDRKLKAIIAEARAFSKRFYQWRKVFMLKKNLTAYGKSACPHCGGKIRRKKTGKWERWSHICPACQRA